MKEYILTDNCKHGKKGDKVKLSDEEAKRWGLEPVSDAKFVEPEITEATKEITIEEVKPKNKALTKDNVFKK